jgi:two-component system cell cycle response regulator CtrA
MPAFPEANIIETVGGRGYVLREPHEEEVRIPA